MVLGSNNRPGCLLASRYGTDYGVLVTQYEVDGAQKDLPRTACDFAMSTFLKLP
jgi:hypothetical protein